MRTIPIVEPCPSCGGRGVRAGLAPSAGFGQWLHPRESLAEVRCATCEGNGSVTFQVAAAPAPVEIHA